MADPDDLAAPDLAAPDLANDERLRALFAQDELPARDLAFSTAVMAEIVRRRFLEDVAKLIGVTTVGGMITWLLWPVLTPAMIPLAQGLAPVAAGLTLAAVVITLAGGRPAEALGFEHD